LLRRMVPGYQAHLHSEPRSFICRYAGTFRAEAPGLPPRYFILMRSVFDPSMTKDDLEVYDLKGSLVNRSKKEGQSVGKDQDWLDAGARIRVPKPVRAEVCAVHAQDLAFLRQFGVMDYSILIGSVSCSCGAWGPVGWRNGGGLLDAESGKVHFIGIIDHLVQYDLGRDFQNLREGDDAEIVPPDRYAARQVSWFREHVMESIIPAEDCGTLGLLKVQDIVGVGIASSDDSAISAISGLLKAGATQVATDVSGFLTAMTAGRKSPEEGTTCDPYVVVTVGLRSAKTGVIKESTTPAFEEVLHLPVDSAEARKQVICLEVWHRANTTMLRGDSCLGRVEVQLQKLLDSQTGTQLLKEEKVEGCLKGKLSAKISLELAGASGSPHAASSEEIVSV